MEKSEKIEKIKALLRPAVENHGAFLVDIALRGEGKREVLEVFCETDKGITIGQCAEISREIIPSVDLANIIGANFRLEVSSPGVGIPLKDKRQFGTNKGRPMSIEYRDGDEIKLVEGELGEVDDVKIVLKTEKAVMELGFDSIIEARVKLRW